MKRLMAENQLEEILKALPENGTLLEWGVGGSTVWLLERLKPGQRIISIEHHPAWGTDARKEIEAKGLSEKWTIIIVSTGSFAELVNAEPGEELPVGLDLYIHPRHTRAIGVGVDFREIDVYLVDGIARGACLATISKIGRVGAPVFLHDTQRDWYGWAENLLWFEKEIQPAPGDYPASLRMLRVIADPEGARKSQEIPIEAPEVAPETLEVSLAGSQTVANTAGDAVAPVGAAE